MVLFLTKALSAKLEHSTSRFKNNKDQYDRSTQRKSSCTRIHAVYNLSILNFYDLVYDASIDRLRYVILPKVFQVFIYSTRLHILKSFTFLQYTYFWYGSRCTFKSLARVMSCVKGSVISYPIFLLIHKLLLLFI